MPDLLEVLVLGHGAIDEMFIKFERNHDPYLVQLLCRDIRLHLASEAAVLGALPEVGGDAAARADRNLLDVLMAVESEAAVDGADLSGPVERLRAAVDEHVAVQERDVFPDLGQAGRERLDELAVEFTARRRDLDHTGPSAGRTRT
jgi:hypothetical protein